MIKKIILILMAILVPTTIGYVRKAKEVNSRYEEKTSYDYVTEWDD